LIYQTKKRKKMNKKTFKKNLLTLLFILPMCAMAGKKAVPEDDEKAVNVLKKGIPNKEKFDLAEYKKKLRSHSRKEKEKEEERKRSYIKNRLVEMVTETDPVSDERIEEIKDIIPHALIEEIKDIMPSKLLEDDVASILTTNTSSLPDGDSYEYNYIDEGSDERDPNWNSGFTNHKNKKRADYMIPGINYPWGEINETQQPVHSEINETQQPSRSEINEIQQPSRSEDTIKNRLRSAQKKTVDDDVEMSEDESLETQQPSRSEDTIKNRLRSAQKKTVDDDVEMNEDESLETQQPSRSEDTIKNRLRSAQKKTVDDDVEMNEDESLETKQPSRSKDKIKNRLRSAKKRASLV
jgi:hypothetical protein